MTSEREFSEMWEREQTAADGEVISRRGGQSQQYNRGARQ